MHTTEVQYFSIGKRIRLVERRPGGDISVLVQSVKDGQMVDVSSVNRRNEELLGTPAVCSYSSLDQWSRLEMDMR